jgi:hypothetical protein
MNALIFYADKRQRACFFDKLGHAFHAPFAFTPCHEIA